MSQMGFGEGGVDGVGGVRACTALVESNALLCTTVTDLSFNGY